ncbi:hypothetical protein TNCV_147521 [Trichonephila clavipes]|nr:hypothetical protein TNCV_147521 [Trichonephila clavipes]
MVIPAYNKKWCNAFHSRRESITGESPTSFPGKINAMSYTGLKQSYLGYNPRVISAILTVGSQVKTQEKVSLSKWTVIYLYFVAQLARFDSFLDGVIGYTE